MIHCYPQNEYGVNSKSSSPVRTPSRRDSGLGKEVYDDYDDEDAESSSWLLLRLPSYIPTYYIIAIHLYYIVYEICVLKIRKLDMYIHLSQ